MTKIGEYLKVVLSDNKQKKTNNICSFLDEKEFEAYFAKEIAEIYEAPLDLVTKDVERFADNLRKKGIL